MSKRPLLSLLLAPLLVSASAQFYAPETEYHDIAQRTFPVEAARVLAWHRGANGQPPLAEVTYEVSITPARETVWKIQWLDASKKTVREREVRYPETQLVSGADHYRSVFSQLAGDDWRFSPASPDNAQTTFWQGAELAGLSRLEAIAAAGKVLVEKPKMSRPADATRLAGILTHGALPIVGTQLTIDSMMLSRAAAWLCLAESMSREKYEAQWCPLIFLTGRENQARACWAELPARTSAKRNSADRFWDLMLRKPGARDFFLFAARPENKAFAMPVFSYLNRMDDSWSSTVVPVIRTVLDDRMQARAFDYMPSITSRGGVDGGHLGSDAPGKFLAAWERTLAEFQPASGDFAGYRDDLAKARTAIMPGEQATVALKRLGPVINRGLDDGIGSLTPVAAVTSRDLLICGWESAGVQFTYLHSFLDDKLGSPEGAKSVAATAFASIKGAEAFFGEVKDMPAAPLPDLGRLQFVGTSSIQFRLGTKYPNWQAAADKTLRLTWLWKAGAVESIENLFRKGIPAEEQKARIERLISEGGPLTTSRLALEFKDYRFPTALRQMGMRERLIEQLPWAVQPVISGTMSGLPESGEILKCAQPLEKLTWENGVAMRPTVVFYSYLRLNALDAARRFYDQVVTYENDQVRLSNTLGPMRFALAWWESDDKGMKQALKDSSTYSWSDLNLQATYALHQGDLSAAGAILDAIADRYPNSAQESKALRDYLPLIAALKDSNHPDYVRALDSFPYHGSWNWTQWILARQAKLSKADTIRFLGGANAIEANQGFVAFLNGDREGLLKRANADWKERFRCTAVFHALMYNEMAEIQSHPEIPDLKPPGAKPLTELVENATNSAGEEITAAADFSKYKTAEEFRAALERLREMPQRSADSPEDRMRQIRAWLQSQRIAADAFIKAYPNDPHRHAARLMAIDASLQLSRLGERGASMPDRNELEAIISAADADQAAKGEAEFFKLMSDSDAVSFSSPHTVPPFQQALSAYLEKYPNHTRSPYVASMLMQILSNFETPSTQPLLKKMAAHPNEQIAMQAKSILQQRQLMLDLKKKPLELKFTAIDGKQVDVVKLRGKVVLIDFWASWCGPCMGDAPSVVAVYKKLRDRGFEIIGVSLDDDKTAMEAAVRSTGMTWPQAFDGKGWQAAIAQRFGVRAIPSTWLFDKKGKLREHGLRGAELESRIENLLQEK